MFDNVILVDYDGVCAYWEHGFDMWMLNSGYKVKKRGVYDIGPRYDISDEYANKLTIEFNKSRELAYLAPFKDAIKYIKKLHEEHGYVFHCISAIEPNEHGYQSRMENIHNLFGKTAFESVLLCGDSKNKEQLLAKYQDSECYWVEDVVKNALYGLQYGLKPLLMDQHYNQDFYHADVQRVHSWKEIYGIITGEPV